MKVSVIGLCGNSLFYELDEMPKKGETIKADNLHTELGGKGFNQAVTLAYLGANVSFLCAMHDDSIKKEALDFSKKENIDCHIALKKLPSPHATILVDKKGNNEVIVYRGSIDELNDNDIDNFKDNIINSDCLLLQYELPLNVIRKAIDIAKNYGVLVVLNPAPYVYDDIELLRKVDIITPNEIEAKSIFKLDELNEEKLIKKIKEYGLKKVVITLGEKGAYIYDNGKSKYIKAYKSTVVDTTGAGDVFNGSLVYSLLEGNSLIEACDFACMQSAKSVSKKYALSSIPKEKGYINEK